MKEIIFFSISLVFTFGVIGQDYSAIDAHAKDVGYSKNVTKITDKLVAPFNDDVSKVRAIFAWVASNIEYDHKKLAKMKSRPRKTRFSGSKEEIKAQRVKQIEGFIEETLDDKKGVCQDFAYLFQAMCLQADIECEFVTGAGKTHPSLIGQSNIPSNHSWNAVKINNKWSLMDVTWSTGMGEKEDFGKGFFDLNPKVMIMSHFPDDTKWQLLDSIYSKSTFINLPFLYSGFIKYEVSDILPYNGKVTRKDVIALKINLPKGSKLAMAKNRKNVNVPVNFDGERYFFDLTSKTLSGNIDICIVSDEGRYEPLYSVSVLSL